jgi:hypothetical protein
MARSLFALISFIAPAVLGFASVPTDDKPMVAKFLCENIEAAAEDTGGTVVYEGGGDFSWCGNDECVDMPPAVIGAKFLENYSCNGEDNTNAIPCDGSVPFNGGNPLPDDHVIPRMLKHFCPVKCGGCDTFCEMKDDLMATNYEAFPSIAKSSSCMMAAYPKEWRQTDQQDEMNDPTCVNSADFADKQEYGCGDWTGYCNQATVLSFGYTQEEYVEIAENCPVACGTCPTVPAVDNEGNPTYVYEETGLYCDSLTADPPSGMPPSYKCDGSAMTNQCDDLFRLACAEYSGLCYPCPASSGRRLHKASLLSSVSDGGFKLTSK